MTRVLLNTRRTFVHCTVVWRRHVRIPLSQCHPYLFQELRVILSDCFNNIYCFPVFKRNTGNSSYQIYTGLWIGYTLQKETTDITRQALEWNPKARENRVDQKIVSSRGKDEAWMESKYIYTSQLESDGRG